jgi:hypothetical protein
VAWELFHNPPTSLSPVRVQTRSFGFVGSMSGLPESGHGWAIYEYTPSLSILGNSIAAPHGARGVEAHRSRRGDVALDRGRRQSLNSLGNLIGQNLPYIPSDARRGPV